MASLVDPTTLYALIYRGDPGVSSYAIEMTSPSLATAQTIASDDVTHRGGDINTEAQFQFQPVPGKHTYYIYNPHFQVFLNRVSVPGNGDRGHVFYLHGSTEPQPWEVNVDSYSVTPHRLAAGVSVPDMPIGNQQCLSIADCDQMARWYNHIPTPSFCTDNPAQKVPCVVSYGAMACSTADQWFLKNLHVKAPPLVRLPVTPLPLRDIDPHKAFSGGDGDSTKRLEGGHVRDAWSTHKTTVIIGSVGLFVISVLAVIIIHQRRKRRSGLTKHWRRRRRRR